MRNSKYKFLTRNPEEAFLRFRVKSDEARHRKVAIVARGTSTFYNKIINQKKSFEKVNNPVRRPPVSSEKH